MIKTFIHRFLSILKSLFLRLSVILTLQIGKDKVEDTNDDVSEDTSER